MMEPPLLQARAVSKSFHTGEGEITVLEDLEVSVGRGERLAILGQSGIGKSTLLHILGTLDHPTSGQVLFEGEDVFAKDPDELASFRNESLGFVFQFHHLLPEFTAQENVMMPGLLRGLSMREMGERAATILEEVEMGHRIRHPVGKLSGGERQRVAVARALVLDPALILADEPTGNLDPATGDRVADMLFDLNERRQTALVVVTHNESLARRLGRAVTLKGGKLVPAGADFR
ncbi:MAG: ABC transporter ATP-binding protein [Deltaproteobacteria bacterium]|nr:ABC transporter ATP-binding protein [Deltaproteobacteria bacterium]MBW2392971.1 ABC transporter ATP-binding protein [Deltaproteobacteria bacterium]